MWNQKVNDMKIKFKKLLKYQFKIRNFNVF